MNTERSTHKTSQDETEKAILILGLCALYLLLPFLKEYYVQAILISLTSCALHTLITFLKGNDIPASKTSLPTANNLTRITKAAGPLKRKRTPDAGGLYCDLKFHPGGNRTATVNIGCPIEDPLPPFKKLIDGRHLPEETSVDELLSELAWEPLPSSIAFLEGTSWLTPEDFVHATQNFLGDSHSDKRNQYTGARTISGALPEPYQTRFTTVLQQFGFVDAKALVPYELCFVSDKPEAPNNPNVETTNLVLKLASPAEATAFQQARDEGEDSRSFRAAVTLAIEANLHLTFPLSTTAA